MSTISKIGKSLAKTAKESRAGDIATMGDLLSQIDAYAAAVALSKRGDPEDPSERAAHAPQDRAGMDPSQWHAISAAPA